MRESDNRISALFKRKSAEVLSIYCTAGYPSLDDTAFILQELEKAGVDLIEIGMPFSDPIADGGTVQGSNQQALENGMHIAELFNQLADIRKSVSIPLILMGYINPVLQYGIEAFCEKAEEVGIDGLILPDLPMWEYEQFYRSLFEQHGLSMTFLITPQTSDERIYKLDSLSNGFLYLVSSASTTGKTADFTDEQVQYFQRVAGMELKNPLMVGFGISSHQHYHTVTSHVQGAVIGSAFIKAIGHGDRERLSPSIHDFIHMIRGEQTPVSP